VFISGTLECLIDPITVDNAIGAQLYYIGSGSTTYTPDFAQSFPSCTNVYSLEINGSSTNIPGVFTFSTVTGGLSVDVGMDLYDLYDLTTFSIEITVRNALSTPSTLFTASDTFVLTIKDNCYDVVLTPPDGLPDTK